MTLYSIVAKYKNGMKMTVDGYRLKASALLDRDHFISDPCYENADAIWHIEETPCNIWQWLRGIA